MDRKIMDREIITAINLHNINMLERVLKNGADPNVKFDNLSLIDGETPLMYVLSINNDSGHYEGFAEVLLENGADPDIKNDEDNQTALMDMAYENNSNNVLLLLDYNADPNVRDYDGDTALIYALKGYINKYADFFIDDYDDYDDDDDKSLDTLSIEYLLEAGSIIDYPKINQVIMEETYDVLDNLGENKKDIEIHTNEIKRNIYSVLQKYDRYNPYKRLSVMSSLNPRLGVDSSLNYLDHDVLSRVANTRYDPMLQRQNFLKTLENKRIADYVNDLNLDQYGSGKRSSSSKRSSSKRSSSKRSSSKRSSKKKTRSRKYH